MCWCFCFSCCKFSFRPTIFLGLSIRLSYYICSTVRRRTDRFLSHLFIVYWTRHVQVVDNWELVNIFHKIDILWRTDFVIIVFSLDVQNGSSLLDILTIIDIINKTRALFKFRWPDGIEFYNVMCGIVRSPEAIRKGGGIGVIWLNN